MRSKTNKAQFLLDLLLIVSLALAFGALITLFPAVTPVFSHILSSSTDIKHTLRFFLYNYWLTDLLHIPCLTEIRTLSDHSKKRNKT